MRFLLPLLFVLYSITLIAQTSQEWSRVYTFDDSTIDMNTALVTRIDKDISRVRFRWTFDKPELSDGFKYQSQLEVMEFNCSLNKYRPYHLTYFDKGGNIVRIQESPGEWRSVAGGMMEKLFVPACDLIRGKSREKPRSEESLERERVAQYAHDFAQQLEDKKDFKYLIDKFFVPEYLDGYLHDQKTNWFPNLSRNTAAKTNRKDLERFYVAVMNTGYLTALYYISQFPADPPPIEELLPPDVLQLLDNHPYTVQYQTKKGAYDFLAETIDNVERLRSYTDLLERIGSLMRTHVKIVRAEHTPNWFVMLDDWNLYEPALRVCDKDCLDLPKGTKVFDVDIPVFHLQIAQIDGKLKVVSAITRF